MQTIFIEENLNHQQINDLCKLIESNVCKSLEFRRCLILDPDFDELMKSLSHHSKTIVSLIFNIQMINEQRRFKKFVQMLSSCSNLINLRIHGNDINDDMFTQLYSILYENCSKLTLLDIGDNKLTNKSIVKICSLIIPNEKRAGLEELILSASRTITNAGWTELFFSISFNSRIRRLALDYNIMDNEAAAMLSIIITSSRTLTCLDLECCNLSEYAGQLFLTLFTKYPVKLQEFYLDKNPSISNSTRTLINECLNLKSRQNSILNEQPLLSHRLSLHDNNSSNTNSIISENSQSVKLKKKKRKSILKEPSKNVMREETKSVGFNQINKSEKPIETKKDEEEEEIEELLPVEIEPYGTVGRMPYWHRT
ncbi:unnamed protein product [Adineta steineri]|uniref:Uncharacterized protein n=1 Tax=Adineta steineri TaxID=433720 RepID=A0A818MMC7_9BILA|nr:unnamed protein product [Adineta steineri]CAF3591463.1 unnamed protein product [Adineta steineri]